MANSGYYWGLYVKEKEKVKTYEKNLEALHTILSNLTDTMGDEINAVNKERDDLESDLEKSVRHNEKFASSVNIVEDEKEKTVTADLHLKPAVDALEAEIADVNRLKNKAETDRDNYYRQYESEKRKEEEEARRAREQALQKIQNILSNP